MTREQIEKLEALTNPVLERSLGLGVPQSVRRLLAERERLLMALRQIAASDHAEDGGPTCDHAYVADAALAFAEESAP